MITHILLGSCIELLGTNLAIDAFGVPRVCAGYTGTGTCGTTAMIGGPVEYAAGHCYLPLPLDDAYYSALGPNEESLWCQAVSVENDNGPVTAHTPCGTDPGIVDVDDTLEIPYGIRAYWAEQLCPPFFRPWLCEVENVCTAQDKLNGDCTCTAAEQANSECTP
jgi:hypothetical protein